MRLWSLHPSCLDARGLVALWREALLARAVLKKKTRGYRHHPQLQRFKACRKPIVAINCYLRAVHEEALKRGYRFDAGKLGRNECCGKIEVTTGQLEYEWRRLLAKLRRRDRAQYEKNRVAGKIQSHPLFKARRGGVAPWEKV